ncbi:MAG: HAD-IA family hydrolase [Opitutales bacterium]|nr:HAD-IA family hydrolase [Opitutales bacterium]
MIRAILFDLDGTLLDRHSSLMLYVHQQMDRCASVLSGIPLPDYLGKVIDLDAHGHQPKDVVFLEVEAHFDLPRNSWKTLLNDFLTHFPHVCVPFPMMHQTLQGLKDRGFELGLVTNGRSASQDPKIDGLGIRHYLGAVLVSEEEGVRKPNPEIFHRALRQLDVLPHETIFVGDNPKADIQAADFVGMKTVWMKDDYWPIPDAMDGEISGLAQLPEFIEHLAQQE